MRYFNPRPRIGGDVFDPLQAALVNSHFNPRPRIGGDYSDLASFRRFGISIHAPV